jgi:hypothetical protein
MGCAALHLPGRTAAEVLGSSPSEGIFKIMVIIWKPGESPKPASLLRIQA